MTVMSVKYEFGEISNIDVEGKKLNLGYLKKSFSNECNEHKILL